MGAPCVLGIPIYSSEVYAALLGDSFGEGEQPPSVDEQTTVPLPEDETSGYVRVCSLPHLKVRGITSLYDFAVMVDKYRCTFALRLQVDSYFPTAWAKNFRGSAKRFRQVEPHVARLVRFAGRISPGPDDLLRGDNAVAQSTP